MRKTVDMILREFGLDPEGAHIINGHVPVKVKSGESPVKANGKLFIIDGGLSKAYQKETGIAGYTLIFSSSHLSLAVHRPFKPGEEHTPEIQVAQRMKHRIFVSDTDIGHELLQQMKDLEELLEAYKNGQIQESWKEPQTLTKL